MKKLDIVAIKTNHEKFYITERRIFRGQWEYSDLIGFLVNGERPTPTFEREWVYVNSEPKSISQMVKQSDINYRYELMDKTLISDKIPEFINREDVAQEIDYEWVWNTNMKQYQSLYRLIYDEQPDKKVECEFDIEIVLETNEIVDPVKMNYVTTSDHDRKETTITEKDVQYQLADKIIFPSIILTQRPCKLSSHTAYKIVRQYIKKHIDLNVATITSDFDFCFTVKRRITLSKTIHYTVNVNSYHKRRKPKYVDKKQTERLDTCFEMTYSPHNYHGYTPISEFVADSQKELKKKIDKYCEDVMKFINVKMVECPHCNGDGVVVHEEGRSIK